MELTDDELEEGRRLLEARNERGMSYPKFMQASEKLSVWLYNHADALLARPEEIAREAVREFAEALFSNRVEVEDGRCSVIYEWRLVKEARARGVTLDEKAK